MSGSVSHEVTPPVPWVVVQAKFYVLKEWSLCFPQSCGTPIFNSAILQGQIPWDSHSLLDPHAGSLSWGSETSQESENFFSVRKFSSLWVAHSVGMELDFIAIARLLLSHCGFFFVCGCGISFFGGFQQPPFDGCSRVQNSCDFGALAEGDQYTPSHSTILNQNPSITYDFYCFLLYYYTKPSSIILNRSDESKNPCLFNILGKSIQYFTINCDTAHGFFTDAL